MKITQISTVVINKKALITMGLGTDNKMYVWNIKKGKWEKADAEFFDVK